MAPAGPNPRRRVERQRGPRPRRGTTARCGMPHRVSSVLRPGPKAEGGGDLHSNAVHRTRAPAGLPPPIRDSVSPAQMQTLPLYAPPPPGACAGVTRYAPPTRDEGCTRHPRPTPDARSPSHRAGAVQLAAQPRLNGSARARASVAFVAVLRRRVPRGRGAGGVRDRQPRRTVPRG